MTKNQENLIRFIADYRIKYGDSPTLQEMVVGINVSDHKSISGIVSALIKQEFLERSKQKTRSILLTDKAFELLGIPPYRRQQQLDGSYPYRQMSHASSGAVASPVPNYVGHGAQSIKTNGTNLANDLRIAVGNTVTGIATKIYSNEEAGVIFSWALLLGGLTWANVRIMGNGTNALIWTAIESVIIKLLSNKKLYESWN
jgi:hypothetical protein